jgi:hypothetical protein
MDDAETRTQWRGNQPGARGGADQREAIQLEWMDARPGPLSDHQVDPVVFHRGIENLFDRWKQTMNLVQKKHFARFERSDDGGQVSFALEQRPGAGLDADPQLVRDNLRKRSLAQSRRPVEQHVIERLASRARGLDGNDDVFLHAILADEVGHAFGTNARV